MRSFLFAACTSFWGSLPPGPGNLAVLDEGLRNGRKAAFMLALGAGIGELPYAFLSVKTTNIVTQFSGMGFWLGIASSIAMLLFAASYFRAQQYPAHAGSKWSGYKLPPFLQGMAVSLLNPVLYGFWLVAFQTGCTWGWLGVDNALSGLGFVLGTGFGAILLLVPVALLTNKIRGWLNPRLATRIRAATGTAFILLALVQFYKTLHLT